MPITKRQLHWLIFLLALVPTLGSLYFSEILGLLPCKLCWWQRIMMYPLVLISLVGLWRRDNSMPYYALPLSVLGMIIAAYHYAIQKLQILPVPETCITGDISCASIYMEYFGFITIPFMSLVGFVLITILLVLSIRNNKSK
jgi:disulfide bond formation protein DsbB